MKTFLKSFLFKKNLSAFSLVEMLVVLGLFSAISTLALGALFNAKTINTKLQESQAILDNVNLSSQTITRDIRFGSVFNCATSQAFSINSVPTQRKNCTYASAAPGTVLFFKPAEVNDIHDRVAYYIMNGVLYKDEYPYGGQITTYQMTTNEVTIKSLIFYVDGAQSSDGTNDVGNATDFRQPVITMSLSGVTKPASSTAIPVEFTIQTTISARELDNK